MKSYSFSANEPIGHLLGRTARAMGAHLQKIFAQEGYDITSEQWVTLVNLLRETGQFQQQIADHTYKDKAAITRLVDGLEKRKLVKRVSDTEDRRQKRIYLTALGENMIGKLVLLAQVAQEKGKQGIDPDRLMICKEVLLEIYENVTEG